MVKPVSHHVQTHDLGHDDINDPVQLHAFRQWFCCFLFNFLQVLNHLFQRFCLLILGCFKFGCIHLLVRVVRRTHQLWLLDFSKALPEVLVCFYEAWDMKHISFVWRLVLDNNDEVRLGILLWSCFIVFFIVGLLLTFFTLTLLFRLVHNRVKIFNDFTFELALNRINFKLYYLVILLPLDRLHCLRMLPDGVLQFQTCRNVLNWLQVIQEILRFVLLDHVLVEFQ